MTFTSYSQNFEDVMLWRALGNIKNGFYIDIGAHDPILGSVTKAFYDRGWNGINIEPISAPFGLLESGRPRDINLQLCTGSYNGNIDIYDVQPSGLATTISKVAKDYRAKGHSVEKKSIAVKTLETICKEHARDTVHFLKIDVEGAEKDVLLGADFNSFRPWIIIVEATCPNSTKQTHMEWESIILNAGYTYAYFDGINNFYVSNKHDELLVHFTTPPNYFDGFALSSTCFFSRQVRDELNQSNPQIKELANELSKSQQLIVNAQTQAEQSETRAVQATTLLQAAYNSRSWRITAPLRWFANQTRLLRHHGLIARTKALTKIITRPIVLRVIAFINSRPGLRRQFVKLSKRLGLYNFARTIYLRFSRLPHQTQPVPNQFITAEFVKKKHTSQHAHRIFTDLRVAISKNHKMSS